jgi:hypothetical protein
VRRAASRFGDFHGAADARDPRAFRPAPAATGVAAGGSPTPTAISTSPIPRSPPLPSRRCSTRAISIRARS